MSYGLVLDAREDQLGFTCGSNMCNSPENVERGGDELRQRGKGHLCNVIALFLIVRILGKLFACKNQHSHSRQNGVESGSDAGNEEGTGTGGILPKVSYRG